MHLRSCTLVIGCLTNAHALSLSRSLTRSLGHSLTRSQAHSPLYLFLSFSLSVSLSLSFFLFVFSFFPSSRVFVFYYYYFFLLFCSVLLSVLCSVSLSSVVRLFSFFVSLFFSSLLFSLVLFCLLFSSCLFAFFLIFLFLLYVCRVCFVFLARLSFMNLCSCCLFLVLPPQSVPSLPECFPFGLLPFLSRLFLHNHSILFSLCPFACVLLFFRCSCSFPKSSNLSHFSRKEPTVGA